jgi:hypothetical protein
VPGCCPYQGLLDLHRFPLSTDQKEPEHFNVKIEAKELCVYKVELVQVAKSTAAFQNAPRENAYQSTGKYLLRAFSL